MLPGALREAEEEIARIARTYHAWRLPAPSAARQAGGEKGAGKYEDVPGFCKSATTEEIAAHGYILTPGRYVGAEEVQDEDEPFEEKMRRLAAKLEEQFAESAKRETMIRKNLSSLGYAMRKEKAP